MMKNFFKLMLDTKPHIQEAQRIKRWINAKKIHLCIIHLNYIKAKTKKKPYRRKNYLPLDEKDKNYICLLNSHVSKKIEYDI